MLNVYLLRHGETPWNADNNRYCGRTDLPLTEKGTQQAQAAALMLKNLSFKAVYSSPLQRAFNTATIAANGQAVIKDDRLIEADFGNWEGKAKEQFIPENEALWESWCKDPLQTKAGASGETAKDVVERVDDFFNSILQQHRSGNVMVVAHNAVNRFYLAYKLGMPLQNYRKLYLDNSSISLFQLNGEGALTLIHLNSKI
ncbi:MAG TPA: histidine phosphatase family protein [Flavisolibacter sp.]|nr:histidine phosphatase family protein [Flavisolibacter sp.]